MHPSFVRRRRRAVSGGGAGCAAVIISILMFALAFSMGLTPSRAWACACGCGVFEVGTANMFPSGQGGTAWLEYDFQDQNRNWSGASQAPGFNNGDKELTTSFFTAGMQYMFDRSWGVEAEIPYWDRSFKTDLNFRDAASRRGKDDVEPGRRCSPSGNLHGIFRRPFHRRHIWGEAADR